MSAGDRLSHGLAVLAVGVGVVGLGWTVVVDVAEGLQLIGLGWALYALAVVAAWR